MLLPWFAAEYILHPEIIHTDKCSHPTTAWRPKLRTSCSCKCRPCSGKVCKGAPTGGGGLPPPTPHPSVPRHGWGRGPMRDTPPACRRGGSWVHGAAAPPGGGLPRTRHAAAAAVIRRGGGSPHGRLVMQHRSCRWLKAPPVGRRTTSRRRQHELPRTTGLSGVGRLPCRRLHGRHPT